MVARYRGRKVTAYKRKGGGYGAYSTKKKRYKVPQNGYIRTGGYYGRYKYGGQFSEKKFFDTLKGGTVLASTGTILDASINLIPQDTTENTRVGRKVVITKIMIRGTIDLPSTTDTAKASDIYRFIIYQDKQCNGAPATVAQILQATTYHSFNNLANSKRFKILLDKWGGINSFTSGNGTNDQAFEKNLPFKFFKDCSIPIEFDASATTGAIATIRSNNIGIMGISRGGDVTFDYQVRVRFNDS